MSFADALISPASEQNTSTHQNRQMLMTGLSTRFTRTNACVASWLAFRPLCAVIVSLKRALYHSHHFEVWIADLINETYACNNDKMLNDILKYSFQGFVQSDWSAAMSTLSAVAGLDMTMPGDITFDSVDSHSNGNLTNYVNDGYISMAR
jgi:hypothetical protein